ncbi:MAG: hypothetical protein DRJ69_02280 [Thermoprotei archaeon]|nr:MAG: hypothetical protein DRJ69_02280 [Thermoprotei archaeon]
MKGEVNKATALLATILMMGSALVTMTTVTVKASPTDSTIGVNEWQSNYEGGEILNMSTKNLYYGNTVDLKFNGSAITDDSYLYKPNYGVKWDSTLGRYVYCVNWTLIDKTISPAEPEPQLDNILLDRAGLWLVITDPQKPPSLGYNANAKVNLSNMSYYDQSEGKWVNITGWFWVNWTSWNIDLSTTEATYDANNSLTITVTYSNGSKVIDPFWIDIWYLKNNAKDFNNRSAELVYHKEVAASDEGVWEISGEFMYRLTHDTGAGVYQIVAYRDVNPGHSTNMYGSEGWGNGVGFNNTFGNETIWSRFGGAGDRYILNCSGKANTLNETTYDWDTCGPFDPPEYLAWKNFTVKANEPTIEVRNETQYYNFSCEITGNVTLTVKDTAGHYIDVEHHGCIYLFNSSSNLKKWEPIDEQHYNVSISDANITIGPNMTDSYGWGHNKSDIKWAGIGKIYVVVTVDLTGDNKPEWNGTATFTITSAPSLEIVWVDDDGGLSSNDKDGVIPRVPSNKSLPVWIKFYVIKGSEHSYEENPENITIYGDALFLENGMTLKKYNETFEGKVVKLENHVWNVSIIPLMDVNGGEITVKVKAKGHTTEKTIQVGGTKLNGTIVSVDPSDFVIGENTTIKVTVTGPKGEVRYPNANVYLFYLNISDKGLQLTEDGLINKTYGGGTSAGEYTFLLNTTQQTDNQTKIYGEIKAPRYIIAYADVANVGYGYAVVKMKPRTDLKVNVSKNTFMAGEATDFWINISTVDLLTGNVSGKPDKKGLHIAIYNETGENVTGKFGWPSAVELSGETNIELTGVAVNRSGTYTIYAYNDTHNSEGFNATIQVIPVKVTCDLNEFIWNYDENVTATFTVTWQGNPVGNGTLRIYNITSKGTYNSTWVNYSASPTENYIDLELKNGVAIMYNITAENLPKNVGQMNITFAYRPEKPGSKFAKADGVVPVKVPDATPTPDKVAVGQTATVNVLVTGRGQPLSGINVTLRGAGVRLNATTGSDGIATFSFLPGSTGKIGIFIENRSTGVTIEVTAHRLEIEVPASVTEGTFTVTVKDEKGEPVEGAYVKFTGTGETKQTNSEGKVSFNITIPGTMPYATYRLIATKPGYRSDEEIITIANVFNLYITAPSKLSAGQKLTVKVTSDTGPVYGVTVTIKKGEEVIDTKTLTGPEGVTFTIPKVKEKTTFTIIAEKEGFKPATYEITVSPAGIPGFELITLLAAIGVAIILLRKKKQ